MIERINWKITLPVDGAREVLNPEFLTYQDEWFWQDAEGHLHFRVRADGDTTSGSTYPRCELREMTGPDGRTKAAWPTNAGRHTMWMRARVRRIPPVKQDMSVAQIHTGSDDLCQAMYRGKGTPRGLVWRWKGTTHTKPLISPLDIDEWFNFKMICEVDTKGIPHVKTYANKLPEMDFTGAAKIHDMLPGTILGNYLKAGNYLQTNVQKGEDPEAEGWLEISELRIKHE